MNPSDFRGGALDTINSSLPKGQTHFFGIAINAYHHFTPLKNAVNDLDAIIDVLLKNYDLQEANVNVLKDEKATRKNILNTLYNYTKAGVLGVHDKLLIYYAGHGCLDENDEGYWVPVESMKGDIDSFLPNLNVQSSIKNMKCRHVLLISDSCFSGSLLVPGRDTSIDTIIAEVMETRKSRWVITSGGRNEVVSDGMGNSPFAKAIVSELNNNKKLKLTADELALKVRSITRANALQIPQASRLFGTGDDLGQFVFNRQDLEPESRPALSIQTPYEEAQPLANKRNVDKNLEKNWKWVDEGYSIYKKLVSRGVKWPALILLFVCSSFIFQFVIRDDKTSTPEQPSTEEMEALDEWVIFIQDYRDKSKAEQDIDSLIAAYLLSGHGANTAGKKGWSDNIYIVRSIVTKDYYSIVIDAASGRGNKSAIEFGINAIKATYALNKQPNWQIIGDKLSKWFSTARPLFYSFEAFEDKYVEVNKATKEAKLKDLAEVRQGD